MQRFLNYGLTFASIISLGLWTSYGMAQNNSLPSTYTTVGTSMQTGEQFLLENKNKSGVVTLPSGLQYKILVAGTGKQPTDTDTVTVHYSGHLLDGKEFDSSYKRGTPATFPVNGVIPGWTEALKLMKVGSTWELYIPAALAYGTRGAPPDIGPNATLLFKVQLIAVNK